MYSAYNKDTYQRDNKELLICIVNNKFRVKSVLLRNKIFK